MANALRPSRAVLSSMVGKLPTQPCQRCFSNRAIQAKQLRPTVARAIESRQPIVQKRTKYKTVEQAKSRYSLGVSTHMRQAPSERLC